jgi:anion-transporting  ArsA/GET3 family ATPase
VGARPPAPRRALWRPPNAPPGGAQAASLGLPAVPPDLRDVRLHVLTGKGGTGKTTVAAALAIALASGGRRTLLCEVEDRQGIAKLFDVPQLPYAERKVTVAPDGGDVFALAVEPRAALMEYLELFYTLGKRAGRVLDKMGAIDFATTIAPGLRDVLLTGKVYEAVRRTEHGRPAYDAVVLDAPPTGRITKFLNVNTEVSGLAKVGPVRAQADSIMRVLRSPQTAVHLVTLLEEMPVQETADGVAELEQAGLPVGSVFVNQVRDELLPADALAAAAEGRLGAEPVRDGLVAAGLLKPSAPGTKMVEALLLEAAEHSERLELQHAERATLAALGRPTVELPLLADGVDLGGLYELADVLRVTCLDTA